VTVDPATTRSATIARQVLSELGIDPGRLQVGASIGDLVADVGEPVYIALVLGLERWLPEPFPEDLLDQIETVDELLDFAEIKLSRSSCP
jgi:hypothetical protein